MLQLPSFLSDYTYQHDGSLIAYEPLKKRTESRLLLVRRNPSGGLPRFEDLLISDLPAVVDQNPELKKHLLVRNRSKVLPARFFARRATGRRHEIVLIEKLNDFEWRAFVKNVSKLKVPEKLTIENTSEQVEVLDNFTVRFFTPEVEALLQKVGRMPLPPYIRREVNEEDTERYQSVWAEGKALSSAAPTASLHFTDELWRLLKDRGISTADAYLHVGRGTFEPLRENELSKAVLHEEAFEVFNSDLEKIKNAESVFAIGTTACRLVETLAHLNSNGADFLRITETGSQTLKGHTRLFVKPGYEFKRVKALLTNFHLPASSLLVLVSVFAGSWNLAKEAYDHALARKYRLFSYGDASLWI